MEKYLGAIQNYTHSKGGEGIQKSVQKRTRGRGLQRRIQRGAKGAQAPVRFQTPNFLKIEIIGFCLTTSPHKSNFHANHAHHNHHAQNWNVEPLSDFRLDPPLGSSKNVRTLMQSFQVSRILRETHAFCGETHAF